MIDIPIDAQRPAGPDPHEDTDRAIFEDAVSSLVFIILVLLVSIGF